MIFVYFKKKIKTDVNQSVVTFFSIFFSFSRCMGEKGNVSYDLAKGKNLLETSVVNLGIYNLIRSDGQQLPSELATKFMELCFAIYTDESEEKLTYKGSLGNFFAEK